MGTTVASAHSIAREAPARASSRRRPVLVAGAVVVLGLLVALAVVLRPGAGPAPLAHKDAAFLDAEHPGVLGFENGDCFEDPEVAAARGEEMLVTVECVGAQNEVVLFVALDDAPAWDEAAVLDAADARCATTVADALGDVERAGYAVYGVPPTARTWADGDRDVMCVLYRPGESFDVEPLADVAAAQG